MRKVICLYLILSTPLFLLAQKPIPVKPRILISTDIGGTDPDDNQSMTHLLMYSNMFQIEGLVSSPSYGHGTKQNILTMIDLYEKDLPKLQKHISNYPSPGALREITKQGRQGAAPYVGYGKPTEGSNWIIKCAKKKSTQPLWILGWGGLEDIAQALHDDPSIAPNIRVYWIGGPNKKWSANSYAYIAQNFPNLWFIENNSSYYGFFSNSQAPDSLKSNDYYDRYIRGAGYLGKDFKNYYKGVPKMGDTPSLLYMMDGNPNDPFKESWGGSFVKFNHSPRMVYHRNTTIADTATVCGIMEFHFKGPAASIPADSACIIMTVKAKIGVQSWAGYYLGNGDYVVRYCPKQAETLSYKVISPIPGFTEQNGQFVVDNIWPGKPRATDYKLGNNWFTDKPDADLFDGMIQGGKTILKWRAAIFRDWAKRWAWLRE